VHLWLNHRFQPHPIANVLLIFSIFSNLLHIFMFYVIYCHIASSNASKCKGFANDQNR
jgi:hypothetical protein